MHLLFKSFVLLASCWFSAAIYSADEGKRYEQDLLEIINIVEKGNLETSLSTINQHIATYPESRVAYLIKADMLKAMSSVLVDVGAGAANNSAIAELAKLLDGHKHQLKNRWQHKYINEEKARIYFPLSLLEMGVNQHVIVGDLQEGRLYLYENQQGVPALVKDYYMSVGSKGYGKQFEGDNKTPVGIYQINKYISDSQLPDLYGKGAFPVNYPNRYDHYLKRTGYGIWLHGTPSSTYARSPWASEGCFVVSNDDFNDINHYLRADNGAKNKTPVILSDGISWVTLAELNSKKVELLGLVKQWQNDWESLNTPEYLDHYAQQDFNFGQNNFKSWSKRKIQVNAGKTFVQVDADIKSLFLYPGEKDMFVVRYKQRYLSNNYKSEADKEQYWQRNEQGKWQILFEG